MKAITSPDNAQFKRWLRLSGSAREVRTRRRTLAEGLHLAEAIEQAGHAVQAVLVRRGTTNAAVRERVARAVAGGVTAFELPAALFDRLTPVERGTGLLLEIGVPEPGALPEGDVLLLDGIQDPGNAGALLRVAAAAGVRGVLATPGTVALWSPKVLRGAQGAHFRLHILEEIAVGELQRLAAVPWFGAAAHGGAPLWRADLSASAVGVMVGAEGSGLSAPAAAACAALLTIPLAAGVESLNVATAAAVLLFERRRQRATRA